jgi:hypothetical protein
MQFYNYKQYFCCPARYSRWKWHIYLHERRCLFYTIWRKSAVCSSLLSTSWKQNFQCATSALHILLAHYTQSSFLSRLVFCDMMSCTLGQQYQCFREPCHIPQKHGYLFPRLYGIMSKHSVILTLSAVTAKNLTSILLFAEWIFNSAHVTSVLILPNSTYFHRPTESYFCCSKYPGVFISLRTNCHKKTVASVISLQNFNFVTFYSLFIIQNTPCNLCKSILFTL